MENITTSITKACSVKSEQGGESKTIHLRVKFDNVPVSQVIDKAVQTIVIQWQTKARKTFSSLVNGSVVNINFVAPARTAIDPEEAMVAKLQAMTPEARQAEFNRLMAMASTPK